MKVESICRTASIFSRRMLLATAAASYWRSRLGAGVGVGAVGVADLVSTLYGSDQKWPVTEQCSVKGRMSACCLASCCCQQEGCQRKLRRTDCF